MFRRDDPPGDLLFDEFASDVEPIFGGDMTGLGKQWGIRGSAVSGRVQPQ